MNKRLTISVAATSSLTPEVSSVGTESSWKRRRVSSSQGYQRTVVSARIYVLLTSIGQFATPSACRRGLLASGRSRTTFRKCHQEYFSFAFTKI